MFDFVRSNPLATKIVMAIVVIPFAVFGGGAVRNLLSDSSTDTVAEVDGHDISRSEWDRQHRQAIEQMRQRNPSVDLKLLDTPQARRASLDRIIHERVLMAAEMRQNLAPSDDRVRDTLQSSPQFAQLRSIPRDQLKAMLAQQGLSLEDFINNLGHDLGRQQALQGVSESGIVVQSSSKASLDAWFEQRDLQWQRFELKDYAARIQPSEEQVKAYYDDKAHAAEFLAPEEAKIEYEVFSIETLKPQMPVSADTVRAFYDNNKDRFGVPEERRASHILVAVAQDAPPDAVAKAKAKAEGLLAELRKNPSGFAGAAKKDSDDVATKEQGGDLDFMSAKTAPAGAFADTLFKMKPGEISEPVRSSAGFHIVSLTATRGGGARPFEEVRPQIEDQLRTELAQKAFASAADKFTNTVYEQSTALPDQVKDDGTVYKLTRQTAVVHRKPEAGAAGPLASARLLDGVFGHDSLQNRHNTEAVDVGGSTLVSARVLEHKPARARPLAEVREQVVGSLRSQLATAAARKDGEAKVEAAKKDAALALPLTATVGRLGGGDVPLTVVTAALKADIAKGPAVLGVPLPDGSFAAVRVVKIAATKAEDQRAAQAKGQIENAFTEAEQSAVFESLKKRYKTRIDEKNLARGSENAASSPG